MSLTWTSPIRRDGIKLLPPLPNEVYVKIFDDLEEHCTADSDSSEYERTLSNLALVCHFFCALALPRIFKSVTFSGDSSSKSKKGFRYVRFCREIVRGEKLAIALALSVKHCSLQSFRSATQWYINGFLDLYLKALPHMLNITRLSLYQVEINKRIVKTMCCLQQLTDLSVENCRFSDFLKTSEFSRMNILKLTSFKFISKDDPNTNAISLADAISFAHLKFLRADSWHFYVTLANQDNPTPLEELHLPILDDPTLLHKILMITPSLTKLVLPPLTSSDPPVGTIIPDSIVPKLKYLVCPPHIATQLVTGRPIEHLTLNGNYKDQNDLDYSSPSINGISALLTRPSNTLRCLTIPVELFFIHDFGKHLNHVHTVTINCKNHFVGPSGIVDNENFVRLMNEVSHGHPMPSLQSLTLAVRRPEDTDLSMELKLQCDQIPNITARFPNLDYIRFADIVHWQKERDMNRSWYWKPHFPPPTQQIT